MTEIALLCAFSMAAGFVDAVVGGGGLIQLPAALLLLPGVPYPMLLGTNKFASLFGTSIAVHRYSRHVKIDWHTIAPAAVTAFLFRVARLAHRDVARSSSAAAARARLAHRRGDLRLSREGDGADPRAETRSA
jgi:hypothetical protein